jgi:hypothetical protein
MPRKRIPREGDELLRCERCEAGDNLGSAKPPTVKHTTVEHVDRVYCKFCVKKVRPKPPLVGYTTKQDLVIHVWAQHRDIEKKKRCQWYFCAICEPGDPSVKKGFPDLSRIYSHMETHREETVFACRGKSVGPPLETPCTQTFRCVRIMIKHATEVHDKKQLYECKYKKRRKTCNIGFNRRGRLLDHIEKMKHPQPVEKKKKLSVAQLASSGSGGTRAASKRKAAAATATNEDQLSDAANRTSRSSNKRTRRSGSKNTQQQQPPLLDLFPSLEISEEEEQAHIKAAIARTEPSSGPPANKKRKLASAAAETAASPTVVSGSRRLRRTSRQVSLVEAAVDNSAKLLSPELLVVAPRDQIPLISLPREVKLQRAHSLSVALNSQSTTLQHTSHTMTSDMIQLQQDYPDINITVANEATAAVEVRDDSCYDGRRKTRSATAKQLATERAAERARIADPFYGYNPVEVVVVEVKLEEEEESVEEFRSY